jgi:hypothetical protein
MTNRMITIRANGIEDYTVLTTVPSLTELQTAVGGYIETIPIFTEYAGNPCVAFCNEEGKLMNMPMNKRANDLWGISTDDKLVGDVVIITGDEAFLAAL